MASVTPRRNRDGSTVWRVQFRVGDKMCQETFTGNGDADAAEKAARRFGAMVDRHGGAAARKILKASQGTDTDTPTLREFTNRYLNPESGLLTGVEPGTRKGYERAAESSFLHILGDYPVDAIQKTDVGRWLAWQEQQPSKRQPGQLVAAKTIRNYHGILSQVLAAAVEQKLRPDNPAYRTRLTKGVKREGVMLTPEEFATILYFLPQHYEGLFIFFAGTGCRWGEATALTWGDFTPERRPTQANPFGTPASVRISKAWKKGETGVPVLKQPKSQKGRRTVSLDPEVVAAMGKPGPANQLIFRGQQSGTHLWYGRTRERVWNRAVEKARDAELCAKYGLEPIDKRPTIHDLRHTHASWLLADGIPIHEVQVRLGHEDITTTVGTYGHVIPDAHARMAQAAGRRLAGVRPLRQIESQEQTND